MLSRKQDSAHPQIEWYEHLPTRVKQEKEHQEMENIYTLYNASVRSFG